MLAKFDVIVCGSLHLDIVVNAPAIPRIDETMVGTAWAQVCGGKGGNQAVQAAQAGAKTAIIGRIGKDAFGDTLRKDLQNSDVDHSAVTTDETIGSGMSVAILQSNGDYGAVIVSGSNLKIDPAALPTQWNNLDGAKILILQNEVPEAVNIAAAKVARANGATTIFNAAPARATSSELMNLVDVLIVNRIEAEAMSGSPVRNRAAAKLAAPKLISKTCSVIITLGGEGLVVSASDGTITEIEAHPVKVTSTHGAGDCFVGTLASELAKGATLVEASKTANKRAAAFVSRA